MLTIFHQCVVSVISIKFLILASFRENPSKTHKKKKESKILICNFNLMDGCDPSMVLTTSLL